MTSRPSPGGTARTTRPHKYGAVRTEYGGQVYPSKAEAAYAQKLDFLKAAGEVQDWGRGAAITLIPGTRKERVTYTPDFWVLLPGTGFHYVDVKGTETAVFKLKMRLLKFTNPTIRLLIVGKHGERWL